MKKLIIKKQRFVLLPLFFAVIGCTSNNITDVQYELTDFSSKVEIHTQEQLDIFINNLDNVISDINYNYLTPYDTRLLKEDMTIPNPIHLSWTAKVSVGTVSTYKVLVSEFEDLSSPITYQTSKKYFDLYNAKTNCKYYWAVKVGKFVSDIHSFEVEDTMIRNLYVDGVNNVRDIGDNKIIKEGLIYRGGSFEKFNKNKKAVEVNITKEGKKTIINQLGIKTEIDLRRNDPSENENCGLTKSTVSGLNYLSLPMQYGNKNILTYDDQYHNPVKIKTLFEFLANKDNYPVYIHCSQGKDRTGCISYLLESLMGYSSNALLADYLFSSLSNYSNRVNRGGIFGSDRYGSTLEDYGESSWTLSQKVYSYLQTEVKISSETLDSVIEILSCK